MRDEEKEQIVGDERNDSAPDGCPLTFSELDERKQLVSLLAGS